MSVIALVSEHASPAAVLGGVDAGGQNVYVACLSAALARRGHQVTVYTRRDDRDAPRRFRMDANSGCSFEVVHIDAGPATPIDKDELLPHMDEFADALAVHLDAASFDLVHSHFWMSGRAAMAAVRPVDLPLVHTFHALGTVKRRHQGIHDHSPPTRGRVERQLLVDADRIVATCGDEVRELLDMGGDRSSIDVVPCGYDNRVFRPEGNVAPRGARHRIVAVSRMVPRKGLMEVVQAVSQIDDLELVIAGGPPLAQLDGDPQYHQLMELACGLGVADRVSCIGGVDQGTIAALDRSADLFVSVPWYEPFGIAPVEAMACGTPVVASAVGGLLDTVVDGATGVHVEPRDVDALARAVRGLLHDDETRSRLGARAAWRARREYAWDVVARRMDAVYTDVLAGRNARRPMSTQQSEMWG